MAYSGARGTLIYEKNLKSKISCQTPFNLVELPRTYTLGLYHIHCDTPTPTTPYHPASISWDRHRAKLWWFGYLWWHAFALCSNFRKEVPSLWSYHAIAQQEWVLWRVDWMSSLFLEQASPVYSEARYKTLAFLANFKWPVGILYHRFFAWVHFVWVVVLRFSKSALFCRIYKYSKEKKYSRHSTEVACLIIFIPMCKKSLEVPGPMASLRSTP
jgi:hypothetical protein